MTVPLDSLAARLRYARDLRGWNQDDLAAAVRAVGGKASRTQVYNWEHGTKPRGETVHALANALGTSPAWLLSGEGRSPSAGSRVFLHEAEDAADTPTRAEFDAMAERVAAVESWIRAFDANADATIADLEQIADEVEGDEDADT
jgi:transcriptional regulator with XRE-family HTH domain